MPSTCRDPDNTNILMDKDWMTILEERSGGGGGSAKNQQEIDQHQPPEQEHEDGNNYEDLIIIKKTGRCFSFEEDFPPHPHPSLPVRDIFTAGSSCSDTTSIGWADDAMESESTDILARQWAQVEQVFHGQDDGIVPEGMSEAIYQEVCLWREAFNSKSKRKHDFLPHRNVNISKSQESLKNFDMPSNFLRWLLFDENVSLERSQKCMQNS